MIAFFNVWRSIFYNSGLDAHFYTSSAAEKDIDIYLDSPDYRPEGDENGIAFYIEPEGI